MTRLFAVIGSSPGVGKSTVCRALAAWRGPGAEHFAEEDILTHQAFRAVAEEFADGAGVVAPATLVACTRAYLAEAVAAKREYVIADALMPYIPSLVAWGHEEDSLVAVMDDLARAAEDVTVTVVYLHDDPETALRRAVAREADGWIDWYVEKLGRQPGTRTVRDFASAVEHLRDEAALTRRLLARTGWDVVEVETGGLAPGEVFEVLRRRL